MKILFINLPHFGRVPEHMPLGPAYLSSYLKEKEKLDICLLDLWLKPLSNQEIKDKVISLKPDIIAITALSTQYLQLKELTLSIKSFFDRPIVLGHTLATYNYKLVLEKTGVDICVIGEGEETFCELLKNDINPRGVKGVAYLEDGVVVLNPSRLLIAELDKISFPDRTIYDVESYISHSKTKERILPIVAGRGCPFSCNFCSLLFEKVRLRSIGNIVEEILELKERYQINSINFYDELVVTSEKRVFELCDALKPLNIKWYCQGRVNFSSLNMFKIMKESGCASVGFGIESGSQVILDAMNKKSDIKKAITAINNAVRAGLIPYIQMIYGYPGENDSTLDETAKFFRKVNWPAPGFFVFTPLPGSPIYGRLIKEGRISDEQAYLEKISFGYRDVQRHLIINLTGFKDVDFFKKKDEILTRLGKEFYLYHPSWILKGILDYYKRNGFRKTIYKVLVKLLPFLLTDKENFQNKIKNLSYTFILNEKLHIQYIQSIIDQCSLKKYDFKVINLGPKTELDEYKDQMQEIVYRHEKKLNWLLSFGRSMLYFNILKNRENVCYVLKEPPVSLSWKAKLIMKIPYKTSFLRLFLPNILLLKSIKKAQRFIIDNNIKLIITLTNTASNRELPFVLAAKKLGIKIYTIVASWDHLTNKMFFWYTPDRIYLWNQLQLEELKTYHELDSKKAVIVGGIRFDMFYDELKLIKKPLLNQGYKKYFLYVFSATKKWGNMDLLHIESVLKALRLVRLNNIKLVIRMHPNCTLEDVLNEERKKEIYNRIQLNFKDIDVEWLDAKRAFIPLDKNNDMLPWWIDLISNSLALITINSTAQVDSLIIGRPAISTILFNRNMLNTWFHLQNLYSRNLVYIPDSIDSLAEILKEIYEGKDQLSYDRQMKVEELVRPVFSQEPVADIIMRDIVLNL